MSAEESILPADEHDRLFARLLRGEAVDVRAWTAEVGPFLQACRERDLAGLLDAIVRTGAAEHAWPPSVVTTLRQWTREDTARELLRGHEVIRVLDALASIGIGPILLKGTALAYSVYDCPAQRPRVDTDVMIMRTRVDDVRRAMASLGYRAPAHCDGALLFCQFPLERVDEHGLRHTFDVHWRISTQTMFADVLRWEELSTGAEPIPALGPHARMPGLVHSLVLACIHPVMHHRNARHLLWQYDIHLLAARFSASAWDTFADLARREKVAAVCAFQLGAARDALGSVVPQPVLERLHRTAGHEPSAEYLAPNRTWLDEQWANLKALPRWRDRARLLREVALPSPAYMRAASAPASPVVTAALLPYLYCRRLVAGSWKVLAGRK
jgi:hypothetical protein